MSVVQLKNGLAGWRKHRPATLPRLPFGNLQPNTVLGDSYIQGVIVAKWNVQKYKDTHLLKIIIQEVLNDSDTPALGSEKLSVFIIGNIVTQWESVIIGDYACMTDVAVEGGPKQTCRVVVEQNAARPPRTWVLKKKDPGVSSSTEAAKTTVRPNKQSYSYTNLKDLQFGRSVNVWGVVKFYKAPTKSRGLDYVQTISIVDPSLSDPEDRIVCLLFTPRIDSLPKFKGIGQIIRLHRLKISSFNGKPQGSSGPGFSWLLFDPSTQASTDPISSSSVSYSFSDKDKEKVSQLRRWADSEACPLTQPPGNSHNDDAVPDPVPDRAIAQAGGEGQSVTPAQSDSPGGSSNVTQTAVTVSHSDLAKQQLESLSKAHMKQGQKYTEVANLKHNTTVNIMGVISFVKPVSKTSRNEFLKVVSIVDQTSRVKVKCLLFASKLDILPESAFAGQIICLHKLNITRYSGEWQGQRGIGFAWTLFDTRQGTAAEKVSCSQGSKPLNNVDRVKVLKLQEWAKAEGLLRYQLCKRICDMQLEKYFDLVCQVVGIAVLEPGKCMLLRIWDGSEPVIPLYEANADDYRDKLQTERTLEEQAYGLMVDVFVFDDHFRSAACLKPGDFIVLTNLHAMRHKPADNHTQPLVARAELCLHHGTTYSRSLRLLDPDTDPLVSDMKERLRQVSPSTSSGTTSSRHVRISTSERKTRSSGASFAKRKHECQSVCLSASPVKKARVESSDSPRAERLARRLAASNDVQPPVEEEVNPCPSSISSDTPRCLQKSATVLTAHRHIKMTPLSEVVKHSPPYKFRVRAQLIDYTPRNGHLYCLQCPTCQHLKEDQTQTPEANKRRSRTRDANLCPGCLDDGDKVVMQKVLRLELLMADSTGWAQTHLWEKEAETFFADVLSPSSPSASAEIQACLDRLCPPPTDDSGYSGRPWMECCIASYRFRQETCFKIFDTMIAVNDE